MRFIFREYLGGKGAVAISKELNEMGKATRCESMWNHSDVQRILRNYDMFVSGMTACLIAKTLTKEGIPTPGGKTTWQASTIVSILTNEKYKGDALLQKKFTTDFLQKKMKVNEGEVSQYYVEGSHPAIISPEMFDRVQVELARRRAIGRKYSGKSIFSCRIVCGDCGEYYGGKVWNKGDKYERTVRQCNAKFTNEVKCTTPHVSEDRIREGFLEAFNQLIPDRERLLEDCRMMQKSLTDTSELDSKIEKLDEEMAVVTELIRHCIEENSAKTQNQGEYMRKYTSLVERYEKLKGRKNNNCLKRLTIISRQIQKAFFLNYRIFL